MTGLKRPRNEAEAQLPAKSKYRVKLTRMGWVCIFVLVWLPIAAMVSMNNYLFILFGLTVGFVLVSHRLATRNLRSLHLSRRFPDEIFAACPFTIGYFARSDLWPWGGANLHVKELPPLNGHENGLALGRVLPNESYETSGVFSIALRGDRAIHPPVVSSSFPFGLAVYSQQRGEGTSVLVFPRIEPVDSHIPLRLLGSGRRKEETNPRGSVPYLLREYVPGDPYKLIDWKKSARTGQLITKVLSEDKAQEILIRVPRKASEEALSKAASLVVHFTRAGAPISLQGRGVLLGPGVGHQFTRKVLTVLARWESVEGEQDDLDHYPGTVVEIDGMGDLRWKQPGEWDE